MSWVIQASTETISHFCLSVIRKVKRWGGNDKWNNLSHLNLWSPISSWTETVWTSVTNYKKTLCEHDAHATTTSRVTSWCDRRLNVHPNASICLNVFWLVQSHSCVPNAKCSFKVSLEVGAITLCNVCAGAHFLRVFPLIVDTSGYLPSVPFTIIPVQMVTKKVD